MARPQQNWGLLILLIRWASIWTMPNTASPKSEPPCGRAVYTPVRATILGHPPQKTAPGGSTLRRFHGEYRFPEKNSSTFQGLFQGHFSSFQGHFQGRSTCIAVKKYRKTWQNLEFLCNLPSSHQSLRTGTWKSLFFHISYGFFFIEMRSIYDNSR